MAEYSPRKEQVESYSEDKCDDESLCMDEVFQDNLDTHTPLKETVELYCEDVYKDDEPLFLDILFMDECDHSGEKTCVKNVMSRVIFERRKLDLSIFTFNKPINDQSFESITQEPQIDESFKNLFKDKLNCLDESIRNVLIERYC